MKKIKSILYKTIVFIWNIIPFKFFFGSFIKFIKGNSKKIYPDLWIKGIIDIKFGNKKILFHCDKNDKMTQHLFWEGLDQSWDATSIKVWAMLAEHSDCIFDVGANIGLYGLVAETCSKKATVICFEPSKLMIETLNKNLLLNNSKIKSEQIAISNMIGEATFYDSKVPSAAASLENNFDLINENHISYSVPLTTLDIYVNESSSVPSLISIDVEGHEPKVLEGMKSLIMKKQPTIIIEVLDNTIGKEIEAQLNGHGYIYYQIKERKSVIRVDHLEQTDNATDSFNFLCVGPPHHHLLTQIEKII